MMLCGMRNRLPEFLFDEVRRRHSISLVRSSRKLRPPRPLLCVRRILFRRDLTIVAVCPSDRSHRGFYASAIRRNDRVRRALFLLASFPSRDVSARSAKKQPPGSPSNPPPLTVRGTREGTGGVISEVQIARSKERFRFERGSTVGASSRSASGYTRQEARRATSSCGLFESKGQANQGGFAPGAAKERDSNR